MREYTILAEHVVRLGRRAAFERTAHLFIELYHRLALIGLASEEQFQIPVSHDDLSDCLGISAVHVHRTLRRLTEEGLIAKRSRLVSLLDIEQLEKIADAPEAFLEDFAVL